MVGFTFFIRNTTVNSNLLDIVFFLICICSYHGVYNAMYNVLYTGVYYDAVLL